MIHGQVHGLVAYPYDRDAGLEMYFGLLYLFHNLFHCIHDSQSLDVCSVNVTD